MFYPTGKTTEGRCLVCMEDESPEIEKKIRECGRSMRPFEALKEWLSEMNYCVECWQMKEYLVNKGETLEKIDEDMGGGGAPMAPAGAPAGNAFATLNTTPGMGIVATPTNGGTNTGFYDATKDGSGDKFPSLTVGTPAAKKGHRKKGVSIASYLDFIKHKKPQKNKFT